MKANPTPLDPEASSGAGPPATSRRTRRFSSLKAKLALACASTLLMVVGGEVAYRAKLYVQLGNLPLGMAATYVLFNEDGTVPDDEFGYRVEPNRQLVGVRVTEGRPVLMYQRQTNELGNYEPPKPHYQEADVKILVFGDSFTAFYGDGTVWPTLLEERLQQRLKRKVCVLNFARDGYGVLDMFDLARARVPEFKPDLVLFCFISDDLDRARLVDQTSQRDIAGSFLDDAVTPAWGRAALQGKDPGGLLLKYNARFEQEKARARPINYLTPRYSFLYNRLVDQDPFSHLPDKTANIRTKIDRFSDDPRFVTALDALQTLEIETLLVHLPELAERQADAYQVTSRQQRLLTNLKQATGWETIELLQFSIEGEVREHYLYPHDLHPSPRGLRFFAMSMDEALRQRELPKLGSE